MRLLPSLLLRLNPYRGNRQLGYAATLAKVFGAGSETTHPHVPAEQPELYSAIDVGSAELEVLECLHSPGVPVQTAVRAGDRQLSWFQCDGDRVRDATQRARPANQRGHRSWSDSSLQAAPEHF